MRIQCVRCKADIALDMTACPSCGRPVDADGNGLPDALDAKMQEVARATVADERAKDARKKEHSKLQGELKFTEMRIKSNRETSRGFVPLFFSRLWFTFVVMFIVWMVIGFAPRAIVAGITDRAISGWLVCELQCPECHGPGKMFQWNYRGSWQSNKGRMGTALVCHNPRYNVDALSWSDVRNTETNEALQPYIVHAFFVHLGDAVVAAAAVALFRAVFRTRKRQLALDPELRELEQKHRELKAKMLG